MTLRFIKQKIITLLALAVLVAPVAPLATVPAYAAPSTDPSINAACQGAGLTGSSCDGQAASDKINNLFKTIVNILSVVVGVVAVVMIIVSGFKYITSAGDSSRIASAKSTLIYAIVGLVIVALAQFIIHFVLTKV